ncbi:hypothetical protein FALBO_3428 [Fusarium albosuccineum]|uniref:Uncharacterized protein n=1 Tax=Fusarium albosuccineum TaxID=1237068 RepID=A0A8H4PL59_9HYPO|nr:hypothetical protein FALBO_3428 [Fusarium albosuccineum]
MSTFEQEVRLEARQLQRFHETNEERRLWSGRGLPYSKKVRPSDVDLAAQLEPDFSFSLSNGEELWPLSWRKKPHVLSRVLARFRIDARRLLDEKAKNSSAACIDEKRTMQTILPVEQSCQRPELASPVGSCTTCINNESGKTGPPTPDPVEYVVRESNAKQDPMVPSVDLIPGVDFLRSSMSDSRAAKHDMTRSVFNQKEAEEVSAGTNCLTGNLGLCEEEDLITFD